MSKDAIQEQIEAMPDGPQKDLAEYMNQVYEREADIGWAITGREYDYDLLNVPIWEPPADGDFTFSDASAITQAQHDKLAALRDAAGGWFYLKDGELIFVTLDEWQKIKDGEIRP